LIYLLYLPSTKQVTVANTPTLAPAKHPIGPPTQDPTTAPISGYDIFFSFAALRNDCSA